MAYESEQSYLRKLWEETEDDPSISSESEAEEEEFSYEMLQLQAKEQRQTEVEIDEEGEQEDEDVIVEGVTEEEVGKAHPGETKLYIYGKDGTKWKRSIPNKRVRTRNENIITHLPGVKGIAREAQTAIECWSLYFTNRILEDIARNTNIKISAKKLKYNKDHHYLVKPTCISEVKAVMGLLYLAGLYKSNRQNLSDLWATDGTGIDIFRKTMSYQRFYILLQCLRFDNPENRTERKKIDKLAAIRAVFEELVQNFQTYYTPSEYLTIDEKLEAFRGRVSFLQYIPNKPAKYGIKVFALVDAKTYYCLNMEVYVGTQPEGPFQLSNKPEDLVLRLIAPIAGTNRNVTFDNWFTSYSLMKNLLTNCKLTSVGTVRKNKREIPQCFLDVRRRNPRSSVFAFQEDITAVSYVPKKKIKA